MPDSLGRDFGMLDLKIVTQNAYNYEEPVTVGYDIYSPQGKLLEFNMTEITIPGRSTDTVRFIAVHLPHLQEQMGGREPKRRPSTR